MLKFAYFIAKEINYKLPAGQDFCNISGGSDRYVLYKIGPVLSVSVSMQEKFCVVFKDSSHISENLLT